MTAENTESKLLTQHINELRQEIAELKQRRSPARDNKVLQ